MTRGMLIFLVLLTLVVSLMYWGIPALKRKFLGESLQVRYSVTMAVDDYDIKFKNTSVSRTVVGLELLFPLGSAPDNVNELQVMGDDGQIMDVNWGTKFEKQDNEDTRTTRWNIKEAFLPLGFRQGMLRTKHRELCYIRVPQVPYP